MTPLAFCLKSQHRLWILHQGNIPLPWPLPRDYAAGVLPYSHSLNFIAFNCGCLKPEEKQYRRWVRQELILSVSAF